MAGRRHPFAEGPDELLQHLGFLRATARRYSKRDESIEDIVQEAAVAALRAKSSDRWPERNARGWFFTLVRRIAAKRRRTTERRQRRERTAARSGEVPSQSAELLLRDERTQLLRRVLGAVDRLSPRYREMIQLRYLQEVPPRDIALRLGIARATVKIRLVRALRLLRAELGSRSEQNRAQGLWLFLLLHPRRRQRLACCSAVAATIAVGLCCFDGAEAAHRTDEAALARGPETGAAQPAEGAPTHPEAPTTSTTPDPRMEIHGTVVFEDAPVAGAEVLVRPAYHDGRRPGHVVGMDQILARGEADSEGVFRLRLPRRTRVSVTASAPGVVAATVLVVAPRRGNPPGTSVRLQRGVRLEGRVVDEAGRAVADAHVTTESGGIITASSRLETRTDSAGRFTLQVHEPDQLSMLKLHVVAPGYPTLGRRLTRVYGRHPLVLRLPRGPGSISGIVRDARGRPRGGVSIMAMRRTDQQTLKWTCVSDETGAYRIDGIPDGRVLLRTRGVRTSQGFGEHLLQGTELVRELSLKATRSIHGRVVDGEGRIVAGARVAVLERQGDHWRSVRRGATDDAGRFVFDALPHARLRLRATTADRYGDATCPVTLPADGIRIRLSPGGRIEGFVRSRGRGATAGGQHLMRVELEFGEERRVEFCGEKTLFVFEHVPVGVPVLLRAWGRAEPLGPFVLRPGEVRQVVVEGSQGGCVEGVVLNANGQPVSNAAVGIRPLDARAELARLEDRFWAPAWTVRTDWQGRFRFRLLKEERQTMAVGWAIGAAHPDHAPAQETRAHLPAPASIERVQLVLPPRAN